ncbi:MAG: DNA translocase FtsK [Planctomycetes bacterium]|jgi:S-DNA-T family DNA segregation ATPase FtsK/SpoIIIE|nr:DNA translocase FtsK [Planctomycetota bacterium]
MAGRGRQDRGFPGSGRRSGPPSRRRTARLLTVAVSLFLFLALLTFSPWDPGRGNLFGAPGRLVAGLLVSGLGFAAFLFVAMVVLWAGTAAFGKEPVRPALRAPGIVIATFCAAGFLSLVLDAAPWRTQGFCGPGGRCGAGMAYRMRSLTGPVGAVVLTGLCGVLGLLAATEWQLLSLGRDAARGGQGLGRRIGAALPPAVAGVRGLFGGAAGGLRRFWPGPSSAPEAEAPPLAPPRPAPAPDVAPPPAEEPPEPEPLVEEAPEPVAREPKIRKPAAKGDGPRKGATGWRFPPTSLLDTPQPVDAREQEEAITADAEVLEKAITNFKVEARVVEWCHGPVVTMYELALGTGVKVNRIHNLAEDLAVALKKPSVRVVAPLPGKDTIGVEVPNRVREDVRLKSLIGAPEFARRTAALPLLIGADVAGSPVIEDLAAMPHLLIAGTTGSGKSVCINSVLLSLLLTRTPEQVRLILVDPKQVELAFFAKIPHLYTPVVTDMKKVLGVFEWLVDQMEQRYDLFHTMQVRNIKAYNELGPEAILARKQELGVEDDEEAEGLGFPNQLPYIVLVVDEFAELMFVSRNEVETQVVRLAQKSRAVGIHIVFATQRPSADVVTGLIKANMPCRVSFQVASRIDSRVVLDSNGADKLLGRGDMLYMPPGTSHLVRAQGTFVSDAEVKRVVKFLSEHSRQEFEPTLERAQAGPLLGEEEKDPLYDEAVRVILAEQRGSASLLQRALGIGYTRGSRIIDQMRKEGIVGPYKGSKASEVLMTLEEYEKKQEEDRP